LLHHCSLTHSFNLYVSSVSLSSTSDFFDSSSAQLNGVEVMMKTAFKILEKNSGPEEAGLLKDGGQAMDNNSGTQQRLVQDEAMANAEAQEG
jgi:hypothetical protein